MSRKPAQFKIGIFVLAGMGILASALFLFGIRGALAPTLKFETYLTGDVEGLSKGSAIKIRGVTVGSVDEIGFSWKLYQDASPYCVVVRGKIEQQFSPVSGTHMEEKLRGLVAHGLRAVVQGQGITGTSIVTLQELDPDKYPPLEFSWRPKHPYIPSAPSQFGQILQSINHTLANLEQLDLKKTLDNVDHAVTSLDVTIQKFGELDVPGISRKVSTLSVDATSAVKEVEGLAKDVRVTLRAMHLEAIGTDADRVVNDLDTRLQALIDKLARVDIGSLNETLADTREAARGLSETVETLKAHPSGFLFGHAPPSAFGLDTESKRGKRKDKD